MDDEITKRLQELEARSIAQGAALAILLREVPAAQNFLLQLANHYENDAPPLALTDASLLRIAACIRSLCHTQQQSG